MKTLLFKLNKFKSFLLIITIFSLFLLSCSSNNYYIYRNDKRNSNNKKNIENKTSNDYNNENYYKYNNKIDINNNFFIRKTKNKIPDNIIIPDYKPSILFKLISKKQYIIKKGDTLYSICRKFNTTIDQIKKINNIKNPDIIKPGQKIIIKNSNLYFYNLSKNFKLRLKTENILQYSFINSQIAFSPLEEGIIKFIGEIRGFGLSIIININNYFVILSGFDNIYVNKNENISLKSPLGAVNNSGLIFISIFQNNKIIKIGKFIKIK